MSDQPIFMRTKSGTKVYLTDNKLPIVEQKRALAAFVKIYNSGFTIEEQKKIANIVYHYNKQGKNWSRVANLPKGMKDKDVYAGHTAFADAPLVKKLNPGKKKMVMLAFSKKSFNNEYAVIHEILHGRDEMTEKSGVRAGLKDEQRTDFETIGRLSKTGLKQQIKSPNGYYAYDKKVTKEKGPKAQLETTRSDIIKDRNLLTGSLNTNITGKVASSRSKNLFAKSFFNRKSLGGK